MKTKIEKLITEAREATDKMFAAFEEMNESLSEKQEPKFEVGDWVRGYDGKDFKVIQRTFALTTRGKSWVYLKDTKGDCQDWYLESQLEKWLPKSREYIYCKDNLDGFGWLSILDAKLAECGKRFDKEKLELVDILEHKEPIVGEMAIFWDSDYISDAFCAIFSGMEGSSFLSQGGAEWDNAILFESVEQYKNFLKS